MNKKQMGVVLGFLAFVLVCAPLAEAAKVMTLKMGKGQAVVSLLEGSARMLPDGKKEWRTLRANDVLRGGDEVTTGARSRLEIVLPDHSRVRFADNSRFKILQLSAGDEATPRNARIHVAVGRSWANIGKAFAGKKGFELSCDNAIAGVRGTVYRMNVNEDQSALIRVYDGTVEVAGGGGPQRDKQAEGPRPLMGAPARVAGPTAVAGPTEISLKAWTTLLKSMQQIAVRADGVAEKPRDFTQAEDQDAWVDWNRERDTEKPGS